MTVFGKLMGLQLLPKVTHGRRCVSEFDVFLSSSSKLNIITLCNRFRGHCEFVHGVQALLSSFVDCNELEALCEDLDPSGTGASSWTSWLAAASLSFHFFTDSLKPVSTIVRLPAGDGLRAKEIVLAVSIEGPTDLLIQTTDARASS